MLGDYDYTTPIRISGDTIMRQAHMTAHDYLLHAVSDINEILGDGAAKNNPQIVAAYLNAAAIDGGSTLIAQQVRLGLDAIASEISDKAVTNDNGEINRSLDAVAQAVQNIAAMLDIIGMRMPELNKEDGR